jgi:hypothetical protein
MRSMLSLALGGLLVLALGAGSVLAAKPEHISESGTFDIPDYCGTGVTLEVAFTSVRNYWATESSEKLTFQTKYVLTAATSDDVVIRTESGQSTFKVVPEANGGYALIGSGAGTPERIKLEHGGLLTRDAGVLTFVDHFDADDNYLGTDVIVRGPHPDFESDFTVQCEVTTEALNM